MGVIEKPAPVYAPEGSPERFPRRNFTPIYRRTGDAYIRHAVVGGNAGMGCPRCFGGIAREGRTDCDQKGRISTAPASAALISCCLRSTEVPCLPLHVRTWGVAVGPRGRSFSQGIRMDHLTRLSLRSQRTLGMDECFALFSGSTQCLTNRLYSALLSIGMRGKIPQILNEVRESFNG